MAISSTRSDRRARRVFATLRFGGDELDPSAVTAMLGHLPTFAHRRGETFRHGSRSPEQIGKTGVWFLSTDELVGSDDLAEHAQFIVRLVTATPTAAPLTDLRLQAIRTFVEQGEITVSASCFWAGDPDEAAPAVPPIFTDLISRLHGRVEIAFDHDWEGPFQHANVA